MSQTKQGSLGNKPLCVRSDAAGELHALGEWLTVERATIGAVAMLAVIWRLWALGDWPLQEKEAHNALESWRIAEGSAGSVSAGPLLIYGNALLFFAFGANDSAPRLLPALGGIALALLPLLLRRELGRGAMLASSALLLFSPTVMYLARVTESTIVLAAASLAPVVFLYKTAVSADHRWLYAAGIALGILALAGPGLYVVVLVLLGAALLWRSKIDEARARPGAGNVALITSGIVVLASTGLLTNLHGIQESLIEPFEHLMSISSKGGDSLRPFAVLLVYEPLLLIFGVVGSFAGLRRRDRWTYFLSWWAALTLLAASLGVQGADSMVALSLPPLALLAGRAIDRAIVGLCKGVGKDELLAYLATNLPLLVLFWISSQFFSMPGAVLPASIPVGSANVPMQFLAEIVLRGEIVLILTAIVGLAFWLNTNKMPFLVALLALVVLGVGTLHTGMLLAYNGSPAELQVAARTSADAREMAREIVDAVEALAVLESSSTPRNRGHAVRVAVGDAKDIVRWYLREQREISYDAGTALEAIVVQDADVDPPPGTFATRRFQVQVMWPGERDAPRLWRWLTLREASGLKSKDMVVYIRMPEQ